MKVLLLWPNYDAHVIHPPLGLGYLASFLRVKNHKVAIFDGTLKNAAVDDFVKEVKDFNPGLVGISVLTRGHNQAKKIIKEIKKNFPKLPVVIGGTQVTAAPLQVMSDLKADFAVIGEGEITFSELVSALQSDYKNNFSKIDGLVYWKNGRPKVNPRRELLKDLDEIPFPAWDLMPPARYRIVPILEPAKAFPVAPILTSRGCPYNCSFCASNVTWGRRIRFRSPENVIEEIKLLKEKYGVREIHFSDDNFTMDIERAEKICDLLIKEKIGLPWQCPNGVRIDRLTLPLLKKMKASGCYAVGLGIESGDQGILNMNQKNLDLKIVPTVLRNLQKVGIESYGFFILGLPGDTRKTIKKTIDFALENPFDRVWFNLFTPYPGSPAFPAWLGKRKFEEIDWDKHDCSTGIVSLTDVSAKELEKFQKEALRKFYLRP
ncbi:MAG: B12-binding domain-containing radical SAM protein, partial [Microgenomates group bacterium]